MEGAWESQANIKENVGCSDDMGRKMPIWYPQIKNDCSFCMHSAYVG